MGISQIANTIRKLPFGGCLVGWEFKILRDGKQLLPMGHGVCFGSIYHNPCGSSMTKHLRELRNPLLPMALENELFCCKSQGRALLRGRNDLWGPFGKPDPSASVGMWQFPKSMRWQRYWVCQYSLITLGMPSLGNLYIQNRRSPIFRFKTIRTVHAPAVVGLELSPGVPWHFAHHPGWTGLSLSVVC